jgi:hypothetical protein
MKQKAIEERHAGASTERVVDDAMQNVHPNVLPYMNPSALSRVVRRSVQVQGMQHWPATINPSEFSKSYFCETVKCKNSNIKKLPVITK